MNCLRQKTIITYKPRCQIIGIQRGRNVQGEGRKSQGAYQPGTGGESARGQTSQGRKSQTANRQKGEKARHQKNNVMGARCYLPSVRIEEYVAKRLSSIRKDVGVIN